MCGIAGILRLDGAPADPAALAPMLSALAHRGPDGEGSLCRGPGALGHRRLAIIDPVGGRQPLENEDGSMALVCNGEIYNYRELRTTLEGLGHRFSSDSDSEVALHAYEQWGAQSVERLRGMFALAVMDWGKRELFLARDALGIKPLLWLQGDGFVAFASELQALRTLGAVDWRLDRQALELYLRLHHIPAPATIYQGVHKLPPASRLTISCSHGVGKVERWWRPHFAPLAERSAAQWAEEALSALDESVKSHLVADVPFGAFLSGGLDSAAVVAAMAAAGVRPLRTFTIGFAEAAFDERPAAAATAARWGAEHHHEEVRPDALALLPALVRHFGEPFGDSSAVPAWYAARLARRQVPMVLSGDGGDELFAGYDHHRDWLAWLRPGPLRRLAGVLAPGAYPPPRADLPGWLHRHAATTARERAQLWRTELRPPTEEVPAAFADALAGGAPAHPLSLAQSLDLQVYLPGDLLTKVDTTAMMHGLEVRTPFADVRLAEFAATIPPTLQAGVVDGHWQGKLVLRQALRGRYPPALLSGRKRGFAVPLAQWFAPGGPLHPALAERLLDARSPLGALFSPAGLQALVRARRAGPLWLLLVLDEWLRQQPGVAL